MHTDPIADLLTRIRNANIARKAEVQCPASNVKEDICKVLQHEGYIEGYSRETDSKQGVLTIKLRYTDAGDRIIQHIARVSKPGRRVYQGAKAMPKVLNGLGIAIVSTSQGVLSDRAARSKNIGGEVLAEVW